MFCTDVGAGQSLELQLADPFVRGCLHELVRQAADFSLPCPSHRHPRVTRPVVQVPLRPLPDWIGPCHIFLWYTNTDKYHASKKSKPLLYTMLSSTRKQGALNVCDVCRRIYIYTLTHT